MDKQESESWNAYAKRMHYVYESEWDGREIVLNKQEILEYEKEQIEIDKRIREMRETQNKK